MSKKKAKVTPGYDDVVKVLYSKASKDCTAAVILHFANGMMFGFYPEQAAELAKKIADAAKEAEANGESQNVRPLRPVLTPKTRKAHQHVQEES